MKSLIDLKLKFHKDTGMFADYKENFSSLRHNNRKKFKNWCQHLLLELWTASETKPTCSSCIHWDQRITDDKRKCFYQNGMEIYPISFIHIGSNFDQAFSVFTQKDYGCINHKNK